MAGTRDDVTRLVEFSLEHNLDGALASFPMFSPNQIRAVYAMSTSQRSHLLSERTADGSIASVERVFQTHRDPAQATKMSEEATDPSNR